MDEFFSFLAFLLFGLFCLLTAPFVVCHVIDHWEDPEPVHSGFSPECPEWTEPISLSPNN